MQTRARPAREKWPAWLDRLRSIYHKYSGIGHFLLAFLLSDACLMASIRPFGLCYGLTLPEKHRLWGTSGAFLGALMICGTRDGLIYGAVAIVALTADTFLLRDSEARELFLPLLLSGIIAIIKLPFALIEGLGAIGLLLAELIIAALASYCLLLAEPGPRQSVRQAVLGSMVISALADLRIVGMISPACAAAIGLTMMVTYGAVQDAEPRRRTDLQGAGCGLLIGAVLDLSYGGSPFYTAVFALAALLASLIPGKGRIGFTLRFLTAGQCGTLWGWGDPRAVGCIYDLFIAASCFLLLPEEWAALRLNADAEYGRTDAPPLPDHGIRRLHSLGQALTALARSIADPSEPEEAVTVVFDQVAAEVCRSCPKAQECWIEDYSATVGSLNDLLPRLRRQGHTAPADLSGMLAARCVRKTELCGGINRAYMSHLRRKAERHSRQARNEQLRAQYAGMSAAVDSLTAAARGDYVHKPMAEKQVAAILAAYRKGLHTEVWRSGGRLHISVGPFVPDVPWDEEEAFVRSAELALGCRLLPAEHVCGRAGETYLYKERETLTVTLSAAVRRKPGEEACGDAYAFFYTDDGRAVVLLSDGMGTGREAARLSRNAVELIAAFVKSGCSVGEGAGAVVPFLRARWSSGFATLDLLEIDLFTGAARLIKCGAADSWLVEGGRVQPLTVHSLPPGADPDSCEAPSGIDLVLRAGCRIVMASDGVEIGDHDLLRRPHLSAAELMDACGQDGRDDRTVLVLSIASADTSAGREV